MEWALLMSLAIAAAAWERFSYHAGKRKAQYAMSAARRFCAVPPPSR